jgi:hypothetical protein
MFQRVPRSVVVDLFRLWPVPVIGLAGVRGPVMFFGTANQDPFDGPFLLITLLVLVVAGVLAGVLARGRPLLGGLASVALLPVATFVEVLIDPTSHNLWPLEFVMYLVLSLPAIGAAALIGLVMRWVPVRA